MFPQTFRLNLVFNCPGKYEIKYFYLSREKFTIYKEWSTEYFKNYGHMISHFGIV